MLGKRLAYLLAAANGYSEALIELTAEEKGQACIEAVINGNFKSLEKLFQEVDKKSRIEAFLTAAHRSHFHLMQWLLNQLGNELAEDDVKSAFTNATYLCKAKP